MKLSNKLYDILKWVALCALPALSTLTCVVSSIWDLSCGEQIIGTIAAVDTFLGGILGISNAKYKKVAATSDVTESDIE